MTEAGIWFYPRRCEYHRRNSAPSKKRPRIPRAGWTPRFPLPLLRAFKTWPDSRPCLFHYSGIGTISQSGCNLRGVSAMRPHFFVWPPNWSKQDHGLIKSRPPIAIIIYKKSRYIQHIALAYLELAALPLGVGTCWAGLLRAAMLATPELVESMGLPEGHTWFYPLMIGYPKFKYHRLPERNAPVIHWK